jgi:serine/threonine protein kinase
VLGNWVLSSVLGEGSFGRVFEAEREDFGISYKAAIKIITIPHSQSEIENARAEGMNEESITSYFRSHVEEIVREFGLMSRLKGTANVVSYEDHTVIKHDNGIGWDIIIRMELLTPLQKHTLDNSFTRRDAIKLGIDICRALELCQKYNIVHRDIKPENIFVSELGDFKLGDFGIARTVEKTTGNLTRTGTKPYMAPEIYRGEAYGSSVDIYSLGLVLYRMLNDNRAPFMPAYPAPITYNDREAALERRISGAQMPSPKNASGRLAEIVLKACAYKPKDRYSSPIQMRQELDSILYSRDEANLLYPQGDEAPIKSLEYIDSNNPPPKPDVQEGTAILWQTDTDTTTFLENKTGLVLPEEMKLHDEAQKKSKGKQADSATKAGKKAFLFAGIPAAIVLVVLLLYFIPGGEEPPAGDPGGGDEVVHGPVVETLPPPEPTPVVTPEQSPEPAQEPSPEPTPAPAPISEPVFDLAPDSPVAFECNFFEAEVRHLIRKPGNEQILVSDVSSIKELNLIDRDILSLAGIEAFTELEFLSCGDNRLRTLDLRGNPNLIAVFADVNRLTSIDVSNNPKLERLGASTNRLESIDVTNNPALIYLSTMGSPLTEIDVSKNLQLEYLSIYNNELTEVDVSANVKLISLVACFNNLTELDLRNNPLIETLWLEQNRFPSLESISGIENLSRLDRSDSTAFRFGSQNR